ncbi:MAG: tetratricopeptide repeat protein [Runella slithyformis]|nr:MAG: tetratricopeptide repeat protein [Runella slithyformis]TAF28820.1 MAG: tetratricopeptide repeat protein [Runella slithyformis]TAF48938.1 MAG: tetratricopeptide repeat protein [Runella slithyformis]TAF83496.1 MAG: tetratricopeptide repeat protein [Runella slithyformis]
MSKQDTDSGLEFLESPEGLAGELGKVEKTIAKNSNVLMIAGVAIVVLLGGWFGYQWYVSSQDEEAQAALFAPIFAAESDSLNKAIKGTAGNSGLLGVADEFSGTPAANVAHFVAGSVLMKQGKFDEAIEQLKSFSAPDLLVQARAYALLGDAYMEKNDAEEAIGYYEKAVGHKPNKDFTPIYMMKLAVAQEKAKKTKEAIETYNKVIETYPQAPEVVNAKKYKGALESAMGE